MTDTYSARHIGKKDAALVAATFKQIEAERGRLTTDDVAREMVSRSRPPNSPTHHLFEWDDSKAAAEYRIERAKRLLAAVLITFPEKPEQPMRAFPVLLTEGKLGPVPMRRALSTPDLLEQLLELALADMEKFKRKYEVLSELRGVIKAMGQVMKKRKGKRRGGQEARP